MFGRQTHRSGESLKLAESACYAARWSFPNELLDSFFDLPNATRKIFSRQRRKGLLDGRQSDDRVSNAYRDVHILEALTEVQCRLLSVPRNDSNTYVVYSTGLLEHVSAYISTVRATQRSREHISYLDIIYWEETTGKCNRGLEWSWADQRQSGGKTMVLG